MVHKPSTYPSHHVYHNCLGLGEYPNLLNIIWDSLSSHTNDASGSRRNELACDHKESRLDSSPGYEVDDIWAG